MAIKQSGGSFSFINVTPTAGSGTLKADIDDTTVGFNDNTSGDITAHDLAGRIVDVIDSAVIIRDVIDPSQGIPTPLSVGDQSSTIKFENNFNNNTGDSLEVIVDTGAAAAGFANVLDRAATGLTIKINDNHLQQGSGDVLEINLDGTGGIGSSASGIVVNTGDGIEISGNAVTITLDGNSLVNTASGLAVANIANSMLPDEGITLDKLDDFGTISNKGVLGTTTSGGAVVHLDPLDARSAIDFDQGVQNYLAGNRGDTAGPFTTITNIEVVNGIVTKLTGS